MKYNALDWLQNAVTKAVSEMKENALVTMLTHQFIILQNKSLHLTKWILFLNYNISDLQHKMYHQKIQEVDHLKSVSLLLNCDDRTSQDTINGH